MDKLQYNPTDRQIVDKINVIIEAVGLIEDRLTQLEYSK